MSPRRDQGGFALITVLAVIALTSVTIGALFGLLTVTMRVTEAQERAAREGRAADGAIESAINQMRTETCDASAPFLAGQLFDQQTPGAGDDVSVDVSCTPSGSGTGSTSDQVRIVGTDGYQGNLVWTTDCAVDASATGCMPWSVVGGVPGGAGASSTALVHSGHEALDISAGLTVRGGGVALRSDAGGTPGMNVGGQYNQGAPGLGAASGDCGFLAGTPGAGAGLIDDQDGSPACDQQAARDLDGDPTGSTSGLVPAPGAPAVPGTCPATVVITFAPGTYDAAATAAVSRLTDGSIAACRNRTFWFAPGIYSFEGTELRFGDAGSYYVFGAPTSWSTAAGVQASAVLAADAEGQLCDPVTSGSTAIVAGWTSITHTVGRVAICPARPADPASDPYPAIYQQTAVPTGVDTTLVTNVPAPNRITVPFSCRVGFGYPANTDYPAGLSGPCRPQRQYEVRLTTAGQAPVSSLRVMLTGTENVLTPNNLITNRATRFNVRTAANGLVCQTGFVTGTPNGGLTSSFDLKQIPGCDGPITQDQLDGGRIIVDHRMDLGLASVQQLLIVSKAEVEINAVSGKVEASGVSATTWNDPGNVATADAAVATPVMPCADFLCQVADPGRTRTPANPFVHQMELSGFTFPGLFGSSNPDLDPAITTVRAVVKVVPSNATLPPSWVATFGNLIDTENFLLPMRTFVELRTPDGGRCVTQGSGVNSDQEVAFDLFDPSIEDPGATSCNTLVLANASDLEDLTLTVRFEMPCIPNWLHSRPGECLRSNLVYDPADTSPVWQFRPPDVEHVQLTTVTDTYTGAPPVSTVTIDTAAGASRAVFNVFGTSWLPLGDLDLNWNGEATATPIFGGDLVVHGLGSRMSPGAEMGVVCCDPPDSRTVDLVATIDGVERLTARVQFIDVRVDGAGNPVYEPGFAVDVLGWSTCPADGCAAVLGAPVNGPP